MHDRAKRNRRIVQLTPIAAVAAGSALGGVARYLVGIALTSQPGSFPLGTFTVNIVGGFLLGVFVRVLAAAGIAPASTASLFLTVGICGGFTTFSAFSLDAVRLVEHGAGLRAVVYVAGSVALGIAAVLAGLHAGRLFSTS